MKNRFSAKIRQNKLNEKEQLDPNLIDPCTKSVKIN
jgi:hypothetical protein